MLFPSHNVALKSLSCVQPLPQEAPPSCQRLSSREYEAVKIKIQTEIQVLLQIPQIGKAKVQKVNHAFLCVCELLFVSNSFKEG